MFQLLDIGAMAFAMSGALTAMDKAGSFGVLSLHL
jgi:uncharacterized membrane protein YeiH